MKIDLMDSAGDNMIIMAALFVVFTILSNFSRKGCDTTLKQLLAGAIFGGFACLSMMVPVYAVDGVIIDSRIPIISMAGLVAGPLGALAAGIPPIILRLHIGGIGALVGVLSILLAMLGSGALGYYIKKYNKGIIPFRWIVYYAIVIAPVCLLPIALFPENIAIPLLVDTGAFLLGINIVGALLLGYLLSQDRNRRLLMVELDALKQKAEEATKAKSNFMARMSHELRTPMNSIVGFTDLLRSTNINDEQRYFLDQIKTSGRTMTDLISDILDFSRMEVGEIKLNLTPLNLAKMIESCGALVDPQAHEKGLELLIEIDPRCPEWVEGDELRIRQILLNLLHNAIKYTNSGYVKLKATAEEAGNRCVVSFCVIDTGIGIPKEKQQDIFHAFELADMSLTRETSGSGLGLSIAQQLAQRMGGNITVESQPAQGSTFKVELPFKRTNAVMAKDDGIKSTYAAEETMNKSILVVEDIAMNRDIVVAMMGKLGYQCSTAHNGAEALERVKRQHFDLIFMDLQMPVMNGYDAARKIREEYGIGSDETPIIALTAHALPEETAKCFEAGMDDFLTKPVEFIELASKVEEWIGGGTDGWDIQQREGSTYENVPLLAEAELRSFVSFVGNDRLLEAYDDFVNDNAARLLIIRTAMEDFEMIRSTLHNMSSTGGNLGMKKLSMYTQHLMDQGVARHRAMELSELDLLDSLFRESCRTFERHIETTQNMEAA
ncbi:MAG: response regulator [Micavibrio aeruginosavorus]|uniref:histidine kinase n=1 Tax=Micavibrio aeruginosavorus TaxID=349221 RepID=A0A7T5R455_9BACT|nr:MAG: response regulator [Micavibrio aeruginosavorus]